MEVELHSIGHKLIVKANPDSRGRAETPPLRWRKVKELVELSFFSPKRNEVRVTQSCPTLCDPMDYTVPGLLQARMLEWIEGKPFLSPGDLPNPGIKPRSPPLQVDSLPSEPPGKPRLNGPFITTRTQQRHCGGDGVEGAIK